MAIAVRILGEVWGLVVDDGSLALLLVGWAVIIGIAVAVADVGSAAAGALLVLGMIAILVENVRRFARRGGHGGGQPPK